MGLVLDKTITTIIKANYVQYPGISSKENYNNRIVINKSHNDDASVSKYQLIWIHFLLM